MPGQGPAQNDQSVAAILPVAGRPQLLVEALHSVLQQTRPPQEIIVIANAPDPEWRRDLGAAGRIAEEYPDLKWQLHFEARRGPAAARNAGVRLANCRWLAFLDSDDLWQPERLARQLHYLQRRPHLRACHTAELWIKNGRQLNQPARLQPRSGMFLRESMATCLISCSSLLIERQLFLELGGFDDRFRVCEDFELWLRLLQRSPIGLVRAPLTIKRSGGWPQLSQSVDLDYWRARALYKLLCANELSEGDRAEALRQFWAKWRIYANGATRRGGSSRARRLAQAATLRFALPADQGDSGAAAGAS
ncbi:MAG: glycosyltransferase family 2 protein [Leptospirales bacterium]|nr:glycosyltransferase family 2 protein [Leptospirales bacterium]